MTPRFLADVALSTLLGLLVFALAKGWPPELSAGLATAATYAGLLAIDERIDPS